MRQSGHSLPTIAIVASGTFARPVGEASAARNVGIEQSRAPIIAFTDDDCRVATDWLKQITTLFAREPEAALVFGRVSIPDELKGKGFAADFEPHQRVYYNKLPPVHVSWGIGANMSARRSVFERLGTFDPLLGPGSPFRAGEESDLTIRAIASGYKVINACRDRRSSSWGSGGRRSLEADAWIRRAMGATLTKHVRLGTRASKLLLWSWLTHFAAKGLLNAVRGKRSDRSRIGWRHASRRLPVAQAANRSRSRYLHQSMRLVAPKGTGEN